RSEGGGITNDVVIERCVIPPIGSDRTELARHTKFLANRNGCLKKKRRESLDSRHGFFANESESPGIKLHFSEFADGPEREAGMTQGARDFGGTENAHVMGLVPATITSADLSKSGHVPEKEPRGRNFARVKENGPIVAGVPGSFLQGRSSGDDEVEDQYASGG